MGAFSIAFDIVIVGALAVPWVLLVINLFFLTKEKRVELLNWARSHALGVIAKDQAALAALASVLFFTMAYPLGSAVSRMAQDFFDDDDLHIRISKYRLQVGVTESSIRAEVYCQQQGLIPQTLINSIAAGPEQFSIEECWYTRAWHVLQIYEPRIAQQNDRAETIFHIQEGAILLKGTDANEKLRQFHDQIMVLRGAAYNGLVAFSLCLFWWCTRYKSKLRWAALSLYLLPGLIALGHHLQERAATDPPYMEFTLLILAAAGWRLLWQRRPKKTDADGEPRPQNGRAKIRFAYLLLSFFLTLTAFLGWWATQVMYDQQVIYSYQALIDSPAGPGTSGSK